jgi:hypothetical protein
MAMDSNVSVFSGERLRKVEGTSIAFSELRSCYEVWCAEQGEIRSPSHALPLP